MREAGTGKRHSAAAADCRSRAAAAETDTASGAVAVVDASLAAAAGGEGAGGDGDAALALLRECFESVGIEEKGRDQDGGLLFRRSFRLWPERNNTVVGHRRPQQLHPQGTRRNVCTIRHATRCDMRAESKGEGAESCIQTHPAPLPASAAGPPPCSPSPAVASASDPRNPRLAESAAPRARRGASTGCWA